jgi:hypothetical protein
MRQAVIEKLAGMQIHFHPHVVFSILSALISLIAAIIAWRRSAPGSLMLSLLLISMAIWSAFYATRWMDISLAAKVSGFKVMYIGILALPTCFLLFVITFTHHDAWLTKHNLILLSLQPIAFLLLQWTNEFHHLYYSSFTGVQTQDFIRLEIMRGPGYFGNIVYSYVIIGIGFLLLSQGALRSSPLYINQYRLLLIGSRSSVGWEFLQ